MATYKVRVMTLTMPMPLDSKKLARVWKVSTDRYQSSKLLNRERVLRKAATVYPAIAVPFNSQAEGVWPLMRKRYSASTTSYVKTPLSGTHYGKRLTDGVAAAEGQYDGLNCKCYREEVDWTWIRLLKVYNFCARSIWKVGRELQIYCQRAERDKKAQRPVQQGQTNRTGSLKDSGGYEMKSAR